MKQIEYLTNTLYGQLGLTEDIFKGSADEKTMLNYYNRTLEPILTEIALNFKRKFLTKTARTQRQSVEFFREPFKLVPVNDLAEIADKFTRNEIMTSNEFRQVIGMKPSDDPKADELRNSNMPQPYEDQGAMPEEGGYEDQGVVSEEDSYETPADMPISELSPEEGEYGDQGVMPEEGEYEDQGMMPEESVDKYESPANMPISELSGDEEPDIPSEESENLYDSPGNMSISELMDDEDSSNNDSSANIPISELMSGEDFEKQHKSSGDMPISELVSEEKPRKKIRR